MLSVFTAKAAEDAESGDRGNLLVITIDTTSAWGLSCNTNRALCSESSLSSPIHYLLAEKLELFSGR